MVRAYSVHIFICTCDICHRTVEVAEDYNKIYNGAQAVRSLGWSYGKDKSVKCDKCRKQYRHDGYRQV